MQFKFKTMWEWPSHCQNRFGNTSDRLDFQVVPWDMGAGPAVLGDLEAGASWGTWSDGVGEGIDIKEGH